VPLLCPVGEHDDRYPLRPGSVQGVLGVAAGVHLERKQFICHIHHVLVPQIVRGDIHHLRALGVLGVLAQGRAVVAEQLQQTAGQVSIARLVHVVEHGPF
jgi:hypothetical protein